jgi:fatty-acyl-CoA synthase
MMSASGSYIQIRDRSKDVIKSGGEWIGSVEVENIIMSHHKVVRRGNRGVAVEPQG